MMPATFDLWYALREVCIEPDVFIDVRPES